MNVAPLTPLTASLNVAVTSAIRLVLVASVAGFRVITVGAGPVRNVHWVEANGLPAASRTAEGPPVSVAV